MNKQILTIIMIGLTTVTAALGKNFVPEPSYPFNPDGNWMVYDNASANANNVNSDNSYSASQPFQHPVYAPSQDSYWQAAWATIAIPRDHTVTVIAPAVATPEVNAEEKPTTMYGKILATMNLNRADAAFLSFLLQLITVEALVIGSVITTKLDVLINDYLKEMSHHVRNNPSLALTGPLAAIGAFTTVRAAYKLYKNIYRSQTPAALPANCCLTPCLPQPCNAVVACEAESQEKPHFSLFKTSTWSLKLKPPTMGIA